MTTLQNSCNGKTCMQLVWLGENDELTCTEIFSKISNTWKVLENEFGPGKSLYVFVIQINQHAYYV